MHMQGTPATMQQAPSYQDVVAEVADFFRSQIKIAQAAGIADGHIILDPGIGFGKTLEHNLALLKATARFKSDFAEPLLIGASRKTSLAALTGRDKTADRLFATVAVTALVVQSGANIVRVHDLVANRDAMMVASAFRGA
jgi:dihydropteroate synthase